MALGVLDPSVPFFDIKTHRSPAQYVREYRHGIAEEGEDYFIVAKQYSPNSNRPAQRGDLTVVACAGIGMIKELYEPLFEDIARSCAAKHVFIRAFWIADAACIGDSAVLNKSNLTSEQNWFDHSRDLLLMINTFHKIMPRPLVGLGHSMGGAQIAKLAEIHPNLFQTILFIEPAIHMGLDRTTLLTQTKAMVKRRETWPSHAEAAAGIEKNPFYKSWDKRCVNLLIGNSFTPLEDDKSTVATKTPRNMEVALVLRPNLYGVGKNGLANMTADDRAAYPDLNPGKNVQQPWYRSEPSMVLASLPSLRPSACFILGGSSKYSGADIRKMRLENTGIGVGGSGGAKLGRVVERVIPQGGHYIMFEKEFLPLVAEKVSEWLVCETKRWADEDVEDREWNGKSLEEKSDIDPSFIDVIKEWHPQTNLDYQKITHSKL